MDAYVKEVRAHVMKKYDKLVKNAYQYLCYMTLLTYNYHKCISYGQTLLKMDCAPTTRYNVLMWVAEA